MQVVVVETGGPPVVVGGDVAVWFGELDEPHTERQLRVLSLDPELVWLAHEHQPLATPHRLRHHTTALLRIRLCAFACQRKPGARPAECRSAR